VATLSRSAERTDIIAMCCACAVAWTLCRVAAAVRQVAKAT